MLSFQYVEKYNAVQVYCDEEGLQTLIAALDDVRSSGGHLHLRAPSGGGHDLSDETPFGEKAVGELIITIGGD
jgi:hypothetical protein